MHSSRRISSHLLLCALTALAMHAARAEPDASDPIGGFIDKLDSERSLLKEAASLPLNVMRQTPMPLQVGKHASDLVLTALAYLGVPYRRGGTTDDGFDCSGFTQRMYELSVGVALPRLAADQAKADHLTAVKRDQLVPGDLVFFNTVRRRAFSHVGIYMGDGKFIHAPKPGGEVRVENMRAKYWTQRFSGARRAEGVVADASHIAIDKNELVSSQ